MKQIILTTTLLAAFYAASFAQQITGNGNLVTKSRPIEAYSAVTLNGSIDVVIEQGDKKSVDVIADENLQDIITTEVKDNTLIISTKPHTGFNTKNKTEVHVYNSKLESVSVNGSGDISGKGKFQFGDLNIDINGSGDIDLTADANNLHLNTKGSGDIKMEGNYNKVEASSNGSGDIKLKGSAIALEFTSAGSGDLDAFGLKVNDATIKTRGSGDAKVNAEKSLTVQSNGSGDVSYKGIPLSKDISMKGSGGCRHAD